MGNATSHLRGVGANETLLRLVSPEPLPPGHPFWNGLLSFRVKTPKTRAEWRHLEEDAEDLLKRFAANNPKSGNFGSLVDIFLSRSAELQSSLESDSSLFVWQTFNALLVLRVATKFFVERLKEEELYRQFCAVAPASAAGKPAENAAGAGEGGPDLLSVDPGQRFDRFVDSLIGIVADFPTS